uniref:Conserved plasma membrane protein n=1 Tax=Panagrellus redivivus TaxID=6233 RepID=A0A7E4VEF1_PANRE
MLTCIKTTYNSIQFMPTRPTETFKMAPVTPFFNTHIRSEQNPPSKMTNTTSNKISYGAVATASTIEMDDVGLLWTKARQAFRRFTTANRIHVGEATLIIGGGVIACIIILLCCCCCFECCRCIKRKYRRHRRLNGTDNRRGLLSLMFAKLDEFESLTPLIVSPNTSIGHANKQAQLRHQSGPPRAAFKPSRHQLLMAASSDSPPPPRRSHAGKTLIVPLNGSGNRMHRPGPVPILGTPDSRITSLEAGTTKSCATIPEDDEEFEEEDEEDDRTTELELVSIDRTYASQKVINRCIAPARTPSTTGVHQMNPGAPISETVPFKEKAPLYEPPDPPWEPPVSIPQRRANLRLATAQSNIPTSSGSVNNNYATTTTVSATNGSIQRKYLPGRDSPGLSSPEASSCGLGSPADTTGSLSDSFLMPSESDDGRGRGGAVYSLDSGEQKTYGPGSSSKGGDDSNSSTSAGKSAKYALHRIEEESEPCVAVEEYSAASTSGGSIINAGRTGRIPRSISQQLEFMKK